ncbi:MAG: UMP kinase [Bacteroidales bacterium]|jgi:uridylate kinase|nr:UMP kinase [Bacteroidales bacterium]
MKYKRILLKLSGESLAGDSNQAISRGVLTSYAEQILDVANAGCQTGIVIGGGNIFRGLSGTGAGFDRVKGDQMGMLATVINSIALESEIIRLNGKAKVYTSIRMEPLGELYNRDKASRDMSNGIICIIAGGTGNPFFTTDTASALRAVELNADLLLKGTRVDGVYSADPERDSSAVRYSTISFDEVIDKRLKVMDLTAITMCRENKLPIVVFNMNEKGALRAVAEGASKGTLVHI